MEVQPFTIHVPDDGLVDLRRRLGHTRFPDEIPGSGGRVPIFPVRLRAEPGVKWPYI